MNSERALELHHRALELAETGDVAGAEDLCRRALSVIEDEAGGESTAAAHILLSLGGILEREGRLQDAALIAERGIRVLESHTGELQDDYRNRLLVHILGLHGTALRQLGAYVEAEKPLSRAVEVAEELPAYPEDLAGALNNFGVLCKFAGWFERGEDAYYRALDVAYEAGEHSDLMATVLHNIGGLAHARGDFQSAEEPLRRAWDTRRALLGDDHPNTLSDAVAYAAVLDGLGRHAESRPIYRAALAAYERTGRSEDHPYAATLHNLAVAEHSVGNIREALDYCRSSLSLKERLLGAKHPDTALTAMSLGAMLLEEGDGEAAQRCLSAALEAFQESLTPEHPHIELCQELLSAATAVSASAPSA